MKMLLFAVLLFFGTAQAEPVALLCTHDLKSGPTHLHSTTDLYSFNINRSNYIDTSRAQIIDKINDIKIDNNFCVKDIDWEKNPVLSGKWHINDNPNGFPFTLSFEGTSKATLKMRNLTLTYYCETSPFNRNNCSK